MECVLLIFLFLEENLHIIFTRSTSPFSIYTLVQSPQHRWMSKSVSWGERRRRRRLETTNLMNDVISYQLECRTNTYLNNLTREREKFEDQESRIESWVEWTTTRQGQGRRERKKKRLHECIILDVRILIDNSNAKSNMNTTHTDTFSAATIPSSSSSSSWSLIVFFSVLDLLRLDLRLPRGSE